MQNHSKRFQIFSAYIGNFFEHYDKALFVILAPFLAAELFPDYDSIHALILTYAMLPIGMIARPFGSLFFGMIGDTKGRVQALRVSLFGMGLVSASVILIPTYGSVGFLAPILFSLARLLANFFSAGETMGGAVFILENSSDQKHDLLSGFYNASTILGYLIASGFVSCFAYFQIIETHWRLLYLIGSLTCLVGCLFRLGPAEAGKRKKEGWVREQFQALWENRFVVFQIAVISGFSYSCFSIALVLMNGFIPEVTDLSKTEVAHMNTLLMLFDFVMLPLFGLLAQKTSREFLMGMAATAAVILGIPLFLLLEGADLVTAAFVRIVTVLIGVAFSAPLHAWVMPLVRQEHRYTTLSFGYALGTQLFGGITAAMSLWLFHCTGVISSAAWYWMGLAFCCCIVIFHSAKCEEPEISKSGS